MKPLSFCFALLLALDLGAAEPTSPAPAPIAEGATELLANVDFGLSADGSLAEWGLTQHAGAVSYERTVSEGVLSLARVGAEPWGQISQSLPADAWAGKRLRFSVELSAELDLKWGPPLQSTGLSISLMGLGPSDLPMMGRRHLLTLLSDPGVPVGETDWQRYVLEFEVPQGRELQLIAAVQLSHGGRLRMRAPSLVVLSE